MQILFVGSIFVVCLAPYVYMAYLAFEDDIKEAFKQLAEVKKPSSEILTISSEDAAKAYEALKKAIIEADRGAAEDAYALAVSGKLFVDPKPVGAPTFKKPKKKKTTKKKPAKRSKK